MSVKLDLPLSKWPIFYIDGEPYIYDDTPLFFDENGEPLGQHPRHSRLAITIYNLLEWLHRNELCTVTFDLYLKAEIELALAAAADAAGEEKVAARVSPDVAYIKGVEPPDKGTYIIDEDGPPPNVIFEVASPNTYQHDLDQKFTLYAVAYRAKEYFAYDPHRKRLWKGSRLRAWRLVEDAYFVIEPDERGWVWSEELQCWLGEDGPNLAFYDEQGERLLTPQEEAVQTRKQLRQAQARLEQERLLGEQQRQRAEEAEARIAQLEEELRKRNPSNE